MKNEWGEVRLGLDAYDLTGKRALVIGAGAPAGRAIALALGEAGADVTVSSVTTDGEEVMRARRVQQELTKMGRKAATVATDVTLGQGVQVMVRQVAKDMGGIDILVNAPDLFLGKPAESTTDIDFNRVMQVNLAGTFHACRAAGKEMLKQERGGRIINVASVLGERAIANAAAYCAAQAGILNLTRALAHGVGAERDHRQRDRAGLDGVLAGDRQPRPRREPDGALRADEARRQRPTSWRRSPSTSRRTPAATSAVR